MNIEYTNPKGNNNHRTFLLIFMAVIIVILLFVYLENAIREGNQPAETCADITVTPPEELSVSIQNNILTISWIGNNTDMTYRVYQSTNPNFNVSDVGNPITTNNTFIEIPGININQGEVVYFKVIAVDDNGCVSQASQTLKVVYNEVKAESNFILKQNAEIVKVVNDNLILTSVCDKDIGSCENILTLTTNNTIKHRDKCFNMNAVNEIVLAVCNTDTPEWTINNNNEICLREDASRCIQSLGLNMPLILSDSLPVDKWNIKSRPGSEYPWCGRFQINKCNLYLKYGGINKKVGLTTDKYSSNTEWAVQLVDANDPHLGTVYPLMAGPEICLAVNENWDIITTYCSEIRKPMKTWRISKCGLCLEIMAKRFCLQIPKDKYGKVKLAHDKSFK